MMTVYSRWADVPPNLKTKTQLAEMGRKPAKKQAPVAKFDGKYGDYELFDIAQTVGKKPASEAQKNALKKAQMVKADMERLNDTLFCEEHGEDSPYTLLEYYLNMPAMDERNAWCEHCFNRLEASYKAKTLLAADCVILDTETTGLRNAHAVEVAIIDMKCNPLLNTRVKLHEGVTISPQSQAIHGISADMLASAPFPATVGAQILWAIKGKQVLIYNASFDKKVLFNTFGIDLKTGVCLMELYAVFCGEWSEYHQSYKWQSLPGGDHSALGDCIATLKILNEMAEFAPKDGE